jgi:hypothetical protein
VSKGDLAGYKLHARTYGGVSDKSLCVKRNDTVTTQKIVTLLDTFLDAFKGKGYYVTMDSAYMGDTMGQIGREEWKINMVGTAQTNRTETPAAADVQKLKVGTYERIFWQHRMLNFATLFGRTITKSKRCQTSTALSYWRLGWACCAK